MPQQFAVVSCDIDGHSRERDPDVQLRQLQAINDLVKATIGKNRRRQFIWASRGDGGHLAIGVSNWGEVALRLILAFRRWSSDYGTPLRVIAHYGEVGQFTGADGRIELFGDTINLVGRLIRYAGPERVVVSDAFVQALEQPPMPEVRFHDPITLTPKYFPPQTVHLLSCGSAFTSSWGTAQDDRARLEQAQAAKDGWEVVYFAKRLMQANSFDKGAEQALHDLELKRLMFERQGVEQVNPVFEYLERLSRVEVIRAAQLVERDDGDLLCDSGDAGDTMFIILRGEIEVPQPPKESIIRRKGDLVGEFAFALHRSRTTAMRCVGPTALLGLAYQHLDAQLQVSGGDPRSKVQWDNVLLSRILYYLCTKANYLHTKDKDHPLDESRRPWERFMQDAARLPQIEVGTVVSFSQDTFARDGLYILVSGRLRSLHLPDEKVLNGDDLPVVYASFPGRLVSVNMSYRVTDEATMIYLGAQGIKRLGAPALNWVIDAVKRYIGQHLKYDVFLSYTFDDLEIVKRWKAKLEEAELKVFMDTANLLRRFPEQLAAALLDSRVLVPLISANTGKRKPEENWVRSEIEYRETCFDPDAANIQPVRLLGGSVSAMSSGYVPIQADGREAEAMDEVITVVQEVRDGQRLPPFATQRRFDVRLRGPT